MAYANYVAIVGYILVIVCTFTRWIELYHTLDATALSAAECLLKYFGRFGAPYQLRSGNGVGAGALIPYKRGDDDVGWFISYRHS